MREQLTPSDGIAPKQLSNYYKAAKNVGIWEKKVVQTLYNNFDKNPSVKAVSQHLNLILIVSFKIHCDDIQSLINENGVCPNIYGPECRLNDIRKHLHSEKSAKIPVPHFP